MMIATSSTWRNKGIEVTLVEDFCSFCSTLPGHPCRLSCHFARPPLSPLLSLCQASPVASPVTLPGLPCRLSCHFARPPLSLCQASLSLCQATPVTLPGHPCHFARASPITLPGPPLSLCQDLPYHFARASTFTLPGPPLSLCQASPVGSLVGFPCQPAPWSLYFARLKRAILFTCSVETLWRVSLVAWEVCRECISLSKAWRSTQRLRHIQLQSGESSYHLTNNCWGGGKSFALNRLSVASIEANFVRACL